jgi:hypothetical protein
MGIDRVGKGAPPVPIPEAGGPAAAHPSGQVFHVPAADAPTQVSPPHIDPTRASGAALERLRSGEIDLGGYVDLKVQEATGHLSGLPAVELDKIRTVLRERLASDPTLVDLVHTATGEILPPDDD